MKEVSRVGDVEQATAAADCREVRKPTRQTAPPASIGLTAPSRKIRDKATRQRELHPAKPGPMSALTTETLVQKAIELMDSKTPAEIAIAVGVSTDGKAVREVIRGARDKFLRHIDAYVDAHAAVVRACMENGDSKSLAVAAAATQWAIENANDGKTRMLEPVKAGGTAGPHLSIGIAVGGVPPAASTFQVSDLPVLAGEVREP